MQDVAGGQLSAALHITKEGFTALIHKLPNRKAPGPDEIPNEILKVAAPAIGDGLVLAVRQCLTSGLMPEQLKESLIIVLKKDSKKDYSLPSSYCLIALENTLAKVIEKFVAEAITDAVEERGRKDQRSQNLVCSPHASR